MNNILFINSPFQLLCGIEYIEEFELEDKDNVLIIFNKSRKNLEQIGNLLEEYGSKFTNKFIVEGELRSISGWYERFLFVNHQLVKKFKNVDKLLIGDYRSGIARHFSNSVSYNKMILLDDGFATLGIEKRLRSSELSSYKDILKKIITLGQYDYKAKKDVCFYSIFYKHLESECVYPNALKSFSKGGEWKKKDEIYWLGSPVVENGKMSLDNYISIIEKWIPKLNGAKVMYFPHRKEKDEKLNNLQNKFNITIEKIELPIELYIVQKKISPKVIISFHSTALISLNKLLKDAAIFYIKLEDDVFLKYDDIRKKRYAILDQEINEISTIESTELR